MQYEVCDNTCVNEDAVLLYLMPYLLLISSFIISGYIFWALVFQLSHMILASFRDPTASVSSINVKLSS